MGDSGSFLIRSLADLVAISLCILERTQSCPILGRCLVFLDLASAEVSLRAVDQVCVLEAFHAKSNLEVRVHLSFHVGLAIDPWSIHLQVLGLAT